MNDTPRTDVLREVIVGQYKEDELTGNGMGNILSALTDIEALERERDEWKAKFIQQNKDLGCEMMDPGGTIWDYAKNLQDENKSLQEQLDAAIMRVQDLVHENENLYRRLESVHEVYRFSSVCRELRDKQNFLIVAAKAVIDRWETPFWKEAAHTGAYIDALRKAVEREEGLEL